MAATAGDAPGAPALRVLVLSSCYPPAVRGGGPIRSLEAMVGSAPPGVALAVVAGDRDLGATARLPVPGNRWLERDGIEVRYLSTDRPLMVWSTLRAIRRWRPDVVYLNSFFSPLFSIGPQLVARVGGWPGARLVIAPRGEFNPGALQVKSRKKQAFLRLYRRLGLARRVVWHAASAAEADRIRDALGVSRFVVREDETSLPVDPSPPPPPSPSPSPPPTRSAGPLAVVFLGRISPIKGLDVLLSALAGVTAAVRLDVYGPVEDPLYAADCRALAADVSPGVSVRFCGTVPHESVRSLLGGYDVLALPSAGESFGHVVAEALSVSCPVLCTPDTPWTPHLRAGGGVVVPDRTVTAWAAALQEYATRSPEQWFEGRLAAGAAYRRWRRQVPGEHLLDLVRAALAGG